MYPGFRMMVRMATLGLHITRESISNVESGRQAGRQAAETLQCVVISFAAAAAAAATSAAAAVTL